MRGKSMILIVIALGCGLVASIGISKILDRQGDGQAAAETKKVYVAVKDVDINDVFDAEMIKLEEWPADRVPEGAVVDLEEVKGYTPSQRLYKGEVIRKEKLVEPGKARNKGRLIPEGYRVQAVKVQSDSSVGNLISPGDHVDVNVYLRKGASIPQSATKTILADVRVFAVNSETSQQVDEDGATINAKTVSLLVKPPQLQTLLLASRLGQISLSLRNPNDDSQSVADDGASVQDLFGAAGDKDGTPRDSSVAKSAADKSADETAKFSQFLSDLAATSNPPKDEQPEQLVQAEFKMILMTPDGMTTYALVDDEQISEAQVVTDQADSSGASQPKTQDVPAAAAADPDFTPSDDDDSADDADSTADSDRDA